MRAYFVMEPRGDARADLRAGLLALQITSASGAKFEGRKPSAYDLSLHYEAEDEEPSEQERELDALLRRVAATGRGESS